MRQVKLKGQSTLDVFNDLGELLEHCLKSGKFLGFTPTAEHDGFANVRYMVILAGNTRGSTVRPAGAWNSDYGNQKDECEHYFIFDTRRGLLEWMKGGE